MNRISITLKELSFLGLLSGDVWEETVRYVNSRQYLRKPKFYSPQRDASGSVEIQTDNPFVLI